uniref:Putative structural protein n=1 Tax=viral metagenome TaxID=1070528 RepID=A0A6M3L1T7_9ZZZZ
MSALLEYLSKIDVDYPKILEQTIQTPLGMLLNALGATREKAADFLGKPFFSYGPGRPGEAEKLKPMAEFASQVIPYETTVQDMALGGLFGGPQAKGWGQAERKFTSLYDKKPRFEIPDNQIVLTDLTDAAKKRLRDSGINANNDKDYLNKLFHARDTEGFKLGDILKHDELYNQYPELKNLTVKKMKGEGALADLNNNTIKLGNFYSEADLLHEIQHFVQKKEGFASGGNPGQFKHLQNPVEEYQRLAGEIESRDVAERMALSPAERARVMPYSSQNIPPSQAIVRYENPLAGGMAQIGPVYHGSPYRFDKFKNEAIGTGEGAQAFGHGHYLTESPGVAGHYAKPPAVGGYKKFVDGELYDATKPEHLAAQYFDMFYKRGKSRQQIADVLNDKFSGDELHRRAANIILEGKEKSVTHVFEKGNIYEATIHKGKKPGEYEYLRWDEKLSEGQKNKIASQIDKEFKGDKLMQEFKKEVLPTLKSGAEVYGVLHDNIFSLSYKYPISNQPWGAEKAASEFLKRSGIDGIKYPAGSLSGMKSDKFNYVVFDPEDIAIEAVK